MNFFKLFERRWYQQHSYSQQLDIHLFCQIWLEEMFITMRDCQVANCSFDGCNWMHFYPRCNFRFHHGNTRFLFKKTKSLSHDAKIFRMIIMKRWRFHQNSWKFSKNMFQQLWRNLLKSALNEAVILLVSWSGIHVVWRGSWKDQEVGKF